MSRWQYQDQFLELGQSIIRTILNPACDDPFENLRKATPKELYNIQPVSLFIENPITKEDSIYLRQYNRLAHLKAHTCTIFDGIEAKVGYLARLRTLVIMDPQNKMSESFVLSLQQLTQLTRLEIVCNMGDVFPTLAPYISDLPALRILRLLNTYKSSPLNYDTGLVLSQLSK